ncbi:cytochrome c oxidase accessory protein CcoG [Sinorhizobium medicae]|uniref:cytochrome c oxidase accessory protein CcoG n=1 Tax=Sinorhizobium medicae TaxID=110321 RepID=UPI000FD4B078|nr:cytochrome c oxidase accessory protein CcoG [Sinorhizobium medicae]MQV97847.1 cytochrome c oxidase accessory protein CcoG [Sinorhizobium medicae]RVH90728.1 cytochrome c oxidase accessory protein CcoG [Sinorhizobium medicae]RVJ49314.1 cytochrome c oxidase accessory protein CcoG [Sinorhizobium medicae]RVJ66811.1 cytochrome c oxidase accessory protein CcoG [Sinorhizobium medicae]RVK16577.1 cytochrome c oxidase accessory protein CcoG [Sinorhizobium medicae]
MLHQPITKDPVERLDAEAVNSARVRGPLYEKRRKIFPKRAEGRFRRFKWLLMLMTLGVYYLTPWIRWDRGAHAPDQAVLIDLDSRRFYFFFIEIWPQEFFFVAGLLVMAGFGLFLVTSAVGRAWCGYACPQTVWVDLFLVVERFIEGDRNARMRLDAAPWSLDKIRKRVAKHAIWLAIGVATGGAWIFYFADAPSLLVSLVALDSPPVAYSTIGILTATTYVFGGLMREQVCTYMCPWPRIQAAMLDENSLVVTYNDWRGEPRSRHAKKSAAAGEVVGDCVDCNACVAVCPMGIDIRDGQQLECITCALCIDACDGVMDKLGREQGLISYATFSDYAANMALATSGTTAAIDPSRVRDADGAFRDKVRHLNWRIVFRPRVLVYFGIWAIVGLGLLFGLLARDRLELNVLHDRNPQFVVESDGSVRNGYMVKLLNMIPEQRTISLMIEGMPTATMRMAGQATDDGRSITIGVEPDKVTSLKVFVTLPKGRFAEAEEGFSLIAEDPSSHERDVYQANFNLPGAARR